MKKVGRPTKYKPEYCELILKFFDRKLYKKVLIKKGVREKGTKDEYKLMPNELPFITEFARKIGVCMDTINEWTRRHPDFSDSLKKAKEMQKEFLIKAGLMNLYNPTFAIFTAKNITNMRDDTNVNININKLLDDIDAPKQKEIERQKLAIESPLQDSEQGEAVDNIPREGSSEAV